MFKKISKTYLAFLIVAGVAIVVLLLERPWAPKVGDVFEKLFLEDLNPQEVARIEIEQLLNGVQLQREGEQWKVAELKSKLKGELEKTENPPSPLRGYGAASREQKTETENGNRKQRTENQEPQWLPADPRKVDLSLSGLQELTIVSLASNNPEKHGYFEASVVGMQVRLFDKAGKKLVHLYIGKTGPAFTESYVRKEGEKEVYIANRYLRSSFPPVAKDWEEKTKK